MVHMWKSIKGTEKTLIISVQRPIYRIVISWTVKMLLSFLFAPFFYEHPVYATCGSKVMALLLKKHVFHFYMPNFFHINGLKAGQNMKKHKMIFKMLYWAKIKFKFKLNEQVSALSSINALPSELRSRASVWNVIVLYQRWTYDTLWMNSGLNWCEFDW